MQTHYAVVLLSPHGVGDYFQLCFLCEKIGLIEKNPCAVKQTLSLVNSHYITLTSVLLNARKAGGVSGFNLISGFLTNGSFKAGATETTAGAGF